MDAAKPKSYAELIKGARQQEREVPICLRGDLVADHLAAVRELEGAVKAASDSLAGGGTGEIVERIRSLEAEMRAHVYPFRLRALPPKRYREFKAEHPVRILDNGDVHDKDEVFGFNAETGFEPLVRMCLVDPELDDQGWAQLMEKLNEPQFDELAAAAWFANRGGIDVPFWSGESGLTQSSESE